MDIKTLDELKAQKQAGKLENVTQGNNIAVQIAAQNGNLELVKWLILESGQPVDATVANNAAVRWAAKNGHLDVVRWLVKESGQAVDVTDLDNYALRASAQNGHLDVVRWLVKESGQAVDVTSVNNSAVCWAATNGHLDVVRWLVLESGQPVDVTANNNVCLQHAAKNGHLDLLKWIFSDLDVAPKIEMRLLIGCAVEKEQIETIKWIVESSGYLVDCRNCNAWKTPVSFRNWPEKIQEYFLHIKMIQDSVGLDNWVECLDQIRKSEMAPPVGSKLRV